MEKRLRVALTLELQWPYKRHAALFAGTQQYAQEQGWESILDEFAAENLPSRRGRPLPYDGVIARANRKLAEKSELLGIPVVNVWFTSPVWRRLPGVFADFEASGRLRAEHLLARGLRRFAVLSRTDRGAKVETRAFRDAVLAAGFPCVEACLPLDPLKTHAQQRRTELRLDAWMREWELPIGVFVYGDEVGRTVVQFCQRRGLRVPQDVAVVTGANEETICEHPRPSLTSMEFGHERIGYEAARMLDRLMRERSRGMRKAAAPPQHLYIPPQGLVARESTDFMAVQDELVSAALSFIASHGHRPIGQDDVARAVHAETRTLQRRFRKALDRPIAAVIRQIRLERAKRELVQSDRSLKEIACDVGCGDAVRLADLFRRELGVTPSRYRQERRFERPPPQDAGGKRDARPKPPPAP